MYGGQGNWNKEPGQLPSGSGHAAVIGVQKSGNFGIITMPNNNIHLMFAPDKTDHINI
jgi:hypothetical protein